MSNVVEKVTFDADTAGLDRAASAVEKLEATFAKLGQKVPAGMRAVAVEADKNTASIAKTTAVVMKAQEASEKRVASQMRQAEAIQKRYDVEYRNAIRQAGVEENLNKLVAAGTLTRQRANEVLDLAAKRHGQVAKAAGVANDNVELAGHQVSNLRSQMIDMGTMLAGGASPFMIISSQAGQVYEALGSGPKGVSGSLKAIGTSIAGLATRSNLIGLGLTAAAGAALYFATRADSSVKTAKDALDDYRKTLDEIGPGYERAAVAAKEAFERARPEGQSVAAALLGESRDVLTASLGAEMDRLIPKTQGFVTEWKNVVPEVLAAQNRIRQLGADLEQRNITVGEFRDRVAQVRLPPNTPPAVRKMVDDILAASVNARDLTNALKAVGAAAGAASDKTGRLGTTGNKPVTLGDRFGRSTLDDRMDPDGMDTIREKLKQQTEEFGRAGAKAAEYDKAMADQRRSIADNVAGLQVQIDHFGATEGAMAAAKMQADLLAEAERNAAEAKQKVDPALVDFIKQQSTEYGRLTDRLDDLAKAEEKRKKLADFDADLEFEKAQVGRTEIEQKVAERMRSAGLAYGDATNSAREQLVRYLETVKETGDGMKDMAKIGRDAFSDIVDAITQGENVGKSLIGVFANVGRQMTQKGADNLFSWLTGGAQSDGGNSAGGAGIDNTLAAVERVRAASLAPVSTSAAIGASPQAQVWRFFESKGLSQVAIAGIMGNAHAESGFNPTAVGDGGNALGLFQWNDRAGALKDFAGDWTDMNRQLDFAWHELNTSERGVLDRLKNSTSVAESVQAFLGFERPQGYSASDPTRSHNYSGRLSAANDAYSNYAGDLRKAVAEGNLDSTRQIVAGVIPGARPSQRAQQLLSNGWDGFSNPGMGGLEGFLQSTGGQALFTGLGAAAQGYSSGSPLGGAFGGLMAGLSTGNPIMAGLGAVAGPIGGRLGRKPRRST